MQQNVVDAEIINDSSFRKKYHIQIRVDENGPKKQDGKRGRIIFENYECTYEQVEFFKSPNTLKANRHSGKDVHIWIDGQLYQDFSKDASEDPNYGQDQGDVPELAISQVGNSDIALAASYLRKVQDDILFYKGEFQKEKAYWDTQIKKLRDEYDELATKNSKKLVEELALVDTIRVKAYNQQYMAAEYALHQEEKGNVVDTIVEGVNKLAQSPIVLGLLARFMSPEAAAAAATTINPAAATIPTP